MKEITKGFKTTEFWISAMTFLFLVVEGVLYYFQGLEPNLPITLGVVGAAVSYGTQRAYVKGKSSLVGMASAVAPAVVEVGRQLASHELPKTQAAPAPVSTTSDQVVVEYRDVNGNLISPVGNVDPLTPAQ